LTQDSKVGFFYEMRPALNYSQSLEYEISESATQAGADRFACMHVGCLSRMADSASSLAVALTIPRRACPSCRHRRLVVVGRCRRHQRRPPSGRRPIAQRMHRRVRPRLLCCALGFWPSRRQRPTPPTGADRFQFRGEGGRAPRTASEHILLSRLAATPSTCCAGAVNVSGCRGCERNKHMGGNYSDSASRRCVPVLAVAADGGRARAAIWGSGM